MNNQFNFKNFEPDFKIRLDANLVLERMMDGAPYGATGVGLLEKRGDEEYCCTLDIYSSQGPFMASVVGATPEKSLECLEEKIRKQLSGWKSRRSTPFLSPVEWGHPVGAAS